MYKYTAISAYCYIHLYSSEKFIFNATGLHNIKPLPAIPSNCHFSQQIFVILYLSNVITSVCHVK